MQSSLVTGIGLQQLSPPYHASVGRYLRFLTAAGAVAGRGPGGGWRGGRAAAAAAAAAAPARVAPNQQLLSNGLATCSCRAST